MISADLKIYPNLVTKMYCRRQFNTCFDEHIIKVAASTTSDIEHMVMPKYGPWLWTKNSDKQLVITADLKVYPIQCKGTGKTPLKPLMRLTQTGNIFFPRRSFFSWQSVQVGTDLLLCFSVASSPTQLKKATHSRWLPSLLLICSVGRQFNTRFDEHN